MSAGATSSTELGRLRSRIEALDGEIIAAVAERVEVARRIGALKSRDGASTLDPEQEAAVVRRAVEAGRRRDLPGEPVRELFWTLVSLSRSAQLEER